MSRRAFTLVELLVTIAIITVLAGFALPALSKARESSKRTQCLSNLRQIGLAMQNFCSDNNGRFPFVTDYAKTWDQYLVERGLLDKKSLVCPSDTKVRTTPSAIKRSYAYNGYFGSMKTPQQPNTIEAIPARVAKPLSGVVLLGDRGTSVSIYGSASCADAYAQSDCNSTHVTGANFLFADLHAEWSNDTGNMSGGAATVATWLQHWRCDVP